MAAPLLPAAARASGQRHTAWLPGRQRTAATAAKAAHPCGKSCRHSTPAATPAGGRFRCQTAKHCPAKPLPEPQSPIPVARPCGGQTVHCTEGLRQNIQRRPVRSNLLRPDVPEGTGGTSAVDRRAPAGRPRRPRLQTTTAPAPRRSSLRDGCTTPPRAAAAESPAAPWRKTLPCTALVPARGCAPVP